MPVIEMPDGARLEFPDDMPQQEMQEAASRYWNTKGVQNQTQAVTQQPQRPQQEGVGFWDALKQQDWRGVAQGVGAGIGGLGAGILGQLGPQAAIPEEVWTVPAAMAGGSAIGGQVYDRAREMLGMAQPQTAGQAAMTAVGDTAYDLGAGAIGGRVVAGASKALNPVSQRLAQAWQQIGQAPPSLAAISERPAVQRVESMLAGTLTGGGRMNAAYEGGRKSLQSALDDAAYRVSAGAPVPQTVEEIGQRALDSAAASKDAFQLWAKSNEDAIFSNIGQDRAGLANTLGWIRQEASNLSPKAADEFENGLRGLIKAELGDAADGTLNINTIRALRTKLGSMLNNPTAVTTGTVGDRQIRGLRSALGADLEESIADPAIKDAYKSYMAEYSREKGVRDLAEKILGNKTPRQIGEKILSPTLSSTEAGILKQAIGKDGYNSVRAGALRQLGRATSGAGMEQGEASAENIARTLGNRKGAYSPETQAALFGNEAEPIREAAAGMAGASKYYNRSETGNQEALARLLRSAPAWGQGLLATGGYVSGGAVPAAMAAAAPWAMARMHTSPAVMKALSSPAYGAAMNFVESQAPRLGLMGGLMMKDDERR